MIERAGEATSLMRLEKLLDGDTCVIRSELPGVDPEKDVRQRCGKRLGTRSSRGPCRYLKT